jgi:hypothetical protein
VPSDSYRQFQEVMGKKMERNEFNAFKGYRWDGLFLFSSYIFMFLTIFYTSRSFHPAAE